METEKEKFFSIYADIPEDLRTEIIAVVDGRSYTWNSAYFEIRKGGELANKILNTLKATTII